jgi:hypothetical protein
MIPPESAGQADREEDSCLPDQRRAISNTGYLELDTSRGECAAGIVSQPRLGYVLTRFSKSILTEWEVGCGWSA